MEYDLMFYEDDFPDKIPIATASFQPGDTLNIYMHPQMRGGEIRKITTVVSVVSAVVAFDT